LDARFFEADTVAMPRAPNPMRQRPPDAKRSGFEAKREVSREIGAVVSLSVSICRGIGATLWKPIWIAH
jgi:hypothetical protein